MQTNPESAAVEAVARYDMAVVDNGVHIYVETIEAELGDYVRYDDHQSALDALRGEVVTAERRVARLEAVLEQAMAHPDFLPPGLLESIESALTKESP